MKRIVFFSVIAVCSLLFASCDSVKDVSYTIFADIAECEVLKNSTLEGARFEEYDASEKDRYLKKLDYNACFAGKFTCDEFAFEIYAYEFTDADGAKQYFENATGKNQSSDDKSSFSLVQGIGIPLFNTTVNVYNGKNAYRIYTDSWEDWRSIKTFLSEIFTEPLSFSGTTDPPTSEENLS